MREHILLKGRSLARTTFVCKLPTDAVRLLLFFMTFASLLFTASCSSDGDGTSRGTGRLRLSLSADTTSLKKGIGNLTKSLDDEFSSFLTTEDYAIRIMRDQDTVKSFARFDEMPAELSLEEGSYTLVASKGDDQPAAFENPYFEGSSTFTVKEDMSTALEVTCMLANTRITAEYTDDFKEAYSDYTVLLSSSYATTEFEIAKGESRPAYMQAAKEGTEMAIGIRLKKITEETEKTYYVPTPLKIERRQNIRLIFKTDGEALEGIGLEIVLDDEMQEVTFTDKIPDFMWKPFEKPTLVADEFKDGDELEVNTTIFNQDLRIGFGMPAGIGSLVIKQWEGDDDADAEYIDLVTDSKTALEKNFSWMVEDIENPALEKVRKTGYLNLKNAIKSLKAPAEDITTYHYQFYGTDATGKQNKTNELSLVVKVKAAGDPFITDFALPVDIVEGDELDREVSTKVVAAGIISESSTLTIGNNSYSLMKEEDRKLAAAYGITITSDVATAAEIIFSKAFTTFLTAPTKGGETSYTVKIHLEDENKKTTEVTKQIVVKAPVLNLLTASTDAFAKRIVLRANVSEKANRKHLSFQYKAMGGDWQSVTSSGLKSAGFSQNGLIQYVDTLKSLTPESTYLVRAVYNKDTDYERMSEEADLTTEKIQGFTNGSLMDPLDDWSIEKDANGSDLPGGDEAKRYWELWQPWSVDSNMGWNTLNKKTTSEGKCDGNKFSSGVQRYVANSGTLKTEGKTGSAALIRTVGWGRNNTAAGTSASKINYSDPGELYLGSYSGSPIYGIDFVSRPSGFAFDYKYENLMKGNDTFIAELVIIDEKDEQTSKRFSSSTVKTDWYRKIVYLDYPQEAAKAKKMYIRFVSGNAGSYGYNDFPVKAPGTNLSNGEYTGSHLYIDNVELIYE